LPRTLAEAKPAAEVIYVQADMSNGEDCVKLVETAADTLGTIDILVNNAGIQYVAPVEEFPPQKWDAIIAINLSSAFHTIRAALPGMKQKKLGPDHQHRLGAWHWSPRPTKVRVCRRPSTACWD
jgi:3-hydroxybutyrate dehydrogenase